MFTTALLLQTKLRVFFRSFPVKLLLSTSFILARGEAPNICAKSHFSLKSHADLVLLSVSLVGNSTFRAPALSSRRRRAFPGSPSIVLTSRTQQAINCAPSSTSRPTGGRTISIRPPRQSSSGLFSPNLEVPVRATNFSTCSRQRCSFRQN